jgi:hypothetical protein
MILSGSQPKGRGSASKWYQILFLFVYLRQKEQEEKSTLICIKVVLEKDFAHLL